MTDRRSFQPAEWVALAFTWTVMAAMLFMLSRSKDVVWLDFSSFYSAATLVSTGGGTSLYDVAAQRDVQQELFLRSDPLLFYHPPFELLPLLPLTRLSYGDALWIWSSAQAALLLLVPALIAPLLPRAVAPLHLATVCFACATCWIALAQGQDSIVLLLLLLLCSRDMAAGKESRAGFWLALALFKFQFVLPLLFILLLRRRVRLLVGFAAGAVLVTALSALVCGWNAVLGYPRFLFEMVRVDAQGTIAPSSMMNLRGLIAASGVTDPLHLVVVVGAIGLAVLAGWLWWSRRVDDPVALFASAVALCALLSYHFNPHDQSILLIPVLVGLAAASAGRAMCIAAIITVAAASAVYSPWTLLALPGLSRLGFASIAVAALAFSIPSLQRKQA